MRPAASNLLDRAAARHELTVRRARQDFGAFVEYAFGLKMAPHHRQWASALQEQRRLLIIAAIEHGKSTIGALAYPVWLLGSNPNARIAIISETATQGSRHLAAIREVITTNARVREVFPRLRPAGTREKWSDAEIVVERSETLKDPSVQALGIGGPLLGARLECAICDDLTSLDNSWTQAQREKVIGWFRATLVGRVVAGGQIVCIGTPWHKNDLLGELERGGEYRVIKTPAVNEAGEPAWPEVWSPERLQQRRRELGEVEFSRQLLCEVVSDAASRFKEAWFESAFRAAAAMGATLADSYTGRRPTFTGVDLGVGLTDAHDLSCLFTLELLPDGRRRVLEIDAGRWQAPELVARIKSARERFRSRVRVETNAAQAYLAQFLRRDGVPIEGHTTGRNRHDPIFGIEGLAVELEAGRWVIPDAPATREWIREMLAYSPAGHPGDRLVGSWLAREAARELEGAPPVLPLSISPERPIEAAGGRAGEDFYAIRDGHLDEDMWRAGDQRWPGLPLRG